MATVETVLLRVAGFMSTLARTKGPHISLDLELAKEVGIQKAIVLSWFIEQCKQASGPVSLIDAEIEAAFHWWKPEETARWVERLIADGYLERQPDGLLATLYSLGTSALSKLKCIELYAAEDEPDVMDMLERRQYYAHFSEVYQQRMEVPYEYAPGDKPQFRALITRLDGTDTQVTMPKWKRAVANYFASPARPEYTLRQLACKYAYYLKSQLDRFGQPVENGNGHLANQRQLTKRIPQPK
jgi:hypothetical protein